jgi:hypothetical protein
MLRAVERTPLDTVGSLQPHLASGVQVLRCSRYYLPAGTYRHCASKQVMPNKPKSHCAVGSMIFPSTTSWLNWQNLVLWNSLSPRTAALGGMTASRHAVWPVRRGGTFSTPASQALHKYAPIDAQEPLTRYCYSRNLHCSLWRLRDAYPANHGAISLMR